MSKQVFCQSCGMPMKTEVDFGTEKAGKKSNEYCHYCYKNGKWTAPDMTFEEMLKTGLEGIDTNDEMSGLMKWIIKKSYPRQLKSLKRWQKQ